MITSEYPPKWGGVGVVSYYLSTWMARMGHEVHVVTREQKIGYSSSHKNISIHPVPWLKAPMMFTLSFGRNAFKWMMSSNIDFDLIHVHSNMALLPAGYYQMTERPIVSTMYGTWKGERSTISFKDLSPSIASINDLAIMTISPFFDKYEDYAIERSNGVIAISDAEGRALNRRGTKNMYGRRIVLPPGIDIEEFHPNKFDPELKRRYGIPEKNQLVSSVGRFAARKGIRELIESFRYMHKERKDITFMLVGWGPLEKEIRRKAKKYGMENALKIVRSPPHEEMQKIVATSDIAMFHSYWEGFGLTFGEALSSCTPIVSTRVGGAPELCPEGTGILVEVGDVKGQASAGLDLLSRDDLDEWGRRGREHIEGYCAWSKIARRTEAFYRWVVDDPENRGEWKKGFDKRSW